MLRTIAAFALIFLLAAPAPGEEIKVSYRSPKATMKSLLLLLKDGEIERLEECFAAPRNEEERALLLYGMADDVYLPALHKALVEQFGAAASPLANTLLAFEQQLQVVDSMLEETDGINGQLRLKGLDAPGIPFVNVEGKWKLAIRPGMMLRPLTPQRLHTAKNVREAYLGTIGEIRQGRFRSPEDAMNVVEDRRQAAFKTGQENAASLPGISGSPGSLPRR